MPLPSTIETCQKHLWDDLDKLNEAGVPVILQERIIRIRDTYNVWLQFPNRREAEIVSELQQKYKIQKSAAYDDLRIIKQLLGNLNQTSKDFHRWKFNNMIQESYEMAKRRKDTRSMVAAADKYAKYNSLDKPDVQENPWEVIAVQPFEPTSDPSVIGIKPVPNIKERIAAKLKQYWNEDLDDITYEEVDFDEESLFKNHPDPLNDDSAR